MSNSEYTPPILANGITSRAEGPDGQISSVSLLLKDANGKMFALHVATEANYIAASNESYGDDVIDFPEPVFIVPAMTIDGQLVDKIISGTAPEVLGLYLVPQE
jgi:hypothetical protein